MNKKLVRQNMSSHLITIGWNESMESAYRRMQGSHIRHLPVTNESGEIVGMLSDRDVQRSMISQIERPSGRIIADETIEFDQDSRVRDYMSWPAKTVDLNAELRFVAERMIMEKVSSLLVCHGERTVGIVTAEDLLKVLIELLTEPGTPTYKNLDELLAGATRQMDSTLI